jgi:hypothetical protein
MASTRKSWLLDRYEPHIHALVLLMSTHRGCSVDNDPKDNIDDVCRIGMQLLGCHTLHTLLSLAAQLAARAAILCSSVITTPPEQTIISRRPEESNLVIVPVASSVTQR